MAVAPSRYDIKLSRQKAGFYESYCTEWEEDEEGAADTPGKAAADALGRLAVKVAAEIAEALCISRGFRAAYEGGEIAFDKAVADRLGKMLAKWWGVVTCFSSLVAVLSRHGVTTDTPSEFVAAASQLKDELGAAAEQKAWNAAGRRAAAKYASEEPW